MEGLAPVANLPKLVNVPDYPPRYFPRNQDIANLRNLIISPKKLLNETISSAVVIGSVGMGGLGKTVLAIAIARDPVIQAYFKDGIFWATVGKASDLLLCQNGLAQDAAQFFCIENSQLDIKNSQQGKAYLKKLFYDKKVLLILDDVWSNEDVNALSVLSEQGRILITSRKAEIVDNIGGKIYPLETLEPNEALEFLKKIAEQDMLPIQAGEIVKECGFLPLAINIIGAKIRLHSGCWNDCLQLLKNRKFVTQDTKSPLYKHRYLYRALEESIEDLNDNQKERYFDFAIFAEDAAIPEQVLSFWWKTKGIDDTDSKEICRTLIDRSLLIRKRHDKVGIHDLLLDYIHREQSADKIQKLHLSLVDAYRKKCNGKWTDSIDDEYLFRYLAKHLREAKQEAELFELLLSSSEWMDKRAKHFTGLTAYFTDTEVAINCIGESLQPQGILRLVGLYAARQAVRQDAKKYSFDDLKMLILLNRTAQAFDYAHFRQDEEQEIRAILSLVETFFSENVDKVQLSPSDVELFEVSILRIKGLANNQKYKKYQDEIESSLAKFYARTKRISNAITSASNIKSVEVEKPELKDNTFLDISEIAISIGDIIAAYEIANKIKNYDKKNQVVRDIALFQIKAGELDNAIKLSKEISVQPYKEAVISELTKEFAQRGKLEDSLSYLRKMNLSPRRETLSDIAQNLAKVRSNKALDVAKEINDPICKVECLCKLVGVFYKAQDDKNTKIALQQAHETAQKIQYLAKAEELQLVAEVSIQIMNYDKPREIIEEIKDIIKNYVGEPESMPENMKVRYKEDGNKCPSELRPAQLDKILSCLQQHLAENHSEKVISEDTLVQQYCRNGNFEKAQELNKSIVDKEIKNRATYYIVEEFSLNGNLQNALYWAKFTEDDENKTFAIIDKSFAKYGNLEQRLKIWQNLTSIDYRIKNDIFCNMALYCTDAEDCEKILQSVQYIDQFEQEKVLQKLAYNFSRQGFLTQADNAFKKKLNIKVKKTDYIFILNILINVFICEKRIDKINELIRLTDNYFKEQSDITKFHIYLATNNIKEIDRRLIFDDKIDEVIFMNLVEIRLSKLSCYITNQDIISIFNDLFRLVFVSPKHIFKNDSINEANSRNKAKAISYLSITKVLSDKGIFDIAKLSLYQAHEYFQKIKPASPIKINDKDEIHREEIERLNNQMKEQFDIFKDEILEKITSVEEYVRNKESILNSYVYFVCQYKDISEAFNALNKRINHDEYILNKKMFFCRVIMEISNKKMKLAKGILDELINYDNSDSDIYIISETYLKLGFIKEAFELIDGKPVIYLISLICNKNIFEEKQTGLFKKILLDSLNKLGWTSQMWQPIYDICESVEFSSYDKKQNNSWLSKCWDFLTSK